MNKYLFTGDLHLTSSPRDSYRWEIFKTLKEFSKSLGVDAVFILGDVTDSKDRHPADLVNRLVREFAGLREEVDVIILKGNHDYVDPKTPFFGFLDMVTEIEDMEIGEDKFVLVPHQKKWDLVREDFTDCDFILCHQCFDGAKAEGGSLLNGVIPDFPKDPIVLAGDIHSPQQVGDVIYCGAPYPIRFGDNYYPRMLYWEGQELQSIRLETVWKLMLDIDDLEELDRFEMGPGDQVKVRYHLDRADFGEWNDIRQQIRTHCTETGAYLAGIILEPKPETDKRRDVTSPNMLSPGKVFESFCVHHNITGDVKDVGLGLMQIGD